MVLIIYDVATRKPREKLERLLREANFVFLFRNARWTSGSFLEIGPLARRISYALRGEAFRVLLMELPPRSAERARWLHGSAPRKMT